MKTTFNFDTRGTRNVKRGRAKAKAEAARRNARRAVLARKHYFVDTFAGRDARATFLAGAR